MDRGTWRAAAQGVTKSQTNPFSFPGGSGSKESVCNAKESACNVGDPGLIPRSARSPGEGNGYLSSILT